MANIREIVKTHITNIFETYESPEEIAVDTEKSIFNSSVKGCKEPSWENDLFTSLYKTKAMKVILNLTTNPNASLMWDMIDEGDISPEDIVEIEPEHLDPERWEKTRKEVIDKIKFEKPDPETMADGVYSCRKCNSMKTSYYQLMTKSGDEGYTNFHSCNICYTRWRTYN
jgi:DNA-directed RNA polymerase subunit M/transcription elongation factor TFIIS